MVQREKFVSASVQVLVEECVGSLEHLAQVVGLDVHHLDVHLVEGNAPEGKQIVTK